MNLNCDAFLRIRMRMMWKKCIFYKVNSNKLISRPKIMSAKVDDEKFAF